MTSLQSLNNGTASAATTSTNIPILCGPATFPAFKNAVQIHCRLRYGQIGQDLINGTTTTVPKIGNKPHYSDEMIHPLTNQSIPGSRKYEREVPPEMKEEEKRIFDYDAIPLTEKGQAKLDKDTAAWEKRESANLTAFTILKDHDDNLCKALDDHISQEAKNQITINPQHATWVTLPFSCTSRSCQFFSMIESLFSKGNSGESVDQASIFFNLRQPQDQPHPAAFINKAIDQAKVITALLQDPTNKGFISINRLHSMVIINGLDKGSSANREGIKTHLHDHPDDALDKTPELIASILKAHMSDLNTDRPSEQSSAFIASSSAKLATKKAATSWTWHADAPDKSAIPGLVHCDKCLKATGNYRYTHSTEYCSRGLPPGEKIRPKKASDPAKLQANAAEAATTTALPTLAACLSFINFNVPDPSLANRADAFAFIAKNHPEFLE